MSKRAGWVIGGVAAVVVFLLLPGWLKVLAIVALVGIPTAGVVYQYDGWSSRGSAVETWISQKLSDGPRRRLRSRPNAGRRRWRRTRRGRPAR